MNTNERGTPSGDEASQSEREAQRPTDESTDTRAPQPLSRGYGGDTGYAQQPASDTIDPNEPASSDR